MKLTITILLLLTSFFSYGQRNSSLLPFRIKVIDGKDTLKTGFNFYMSNNNHNFYPTTNDSLKCYQFQNIDSIADFHIIFKSREFIFKDIETMRLMFEDEWTVTLDTLATSECYEIIADHAGCFVNVYLTPYPIPTCSNKNHIWLTSFSTDWGKGINVKGSREMKRNRRKQK